MRQLEDQFHHEGAVTAVGGRWLGVPRRIGGVAERWCAVRVGADGEGGGGAYFAVSFPSFGAMTCPCNSSSGTTPCSTPPPCSPP